MKKLIATSAILAALAGTASAAPYVLPSQQTGALTANDVQPVYTLDAVIALGDGADVPDMYGPRLALNLYNDHNDTFTHAFNLSVSALWGSEDTEGFDIDYFMLPLTIGYDLNIEVTDKLDFYVGGKAGYAWLDADSSYFDDSDSGFTWGVGAGFRYYFSENIHARVGYEFSRTYTDVPFGQHSILIGVGCRF
ncbi:MAG TPA: porin family protein [Candidatus Akkermansia intestinigallinarum]|uniref:Porin family protein n=1 Tax=Candidatus Akkermansia intestinigallinarum TaxID=2838431 RepID=A0A9D1VBB9_9BACT|nr:porin family protein [Candidatus Akkermansia intestinigallinarum]